MFGKMSSGTNPTIYALSGAILGVSIICVLLVMLGQGSKADLALRPGLNFARSAK